MDGLKHATVFRDRHRYVMGPSLTVTQAGDWLCSFNMTVMREVGPQSPFPFLHPPVDPEYRNYLTRSQDRGATWDAPRVFPGYDWFGLEMPALCTLSSGAIIASVYRRDFYPVDSAARNQGLLGCVKLEPYPWVAAHGGTYVHHSFDGGLTWPKSVAVDTFPYISGYSPNPALEMPDGTLFLPLAAADPFFPTFSKESGLDVGCLGNEWDENARIKSSHSAAFLAISRDGGETWSETHEIAQHTAFGFFEPALARLRSGRLICHLRTEVYGGGEGFIYQVVSDDGGATWTEPKRVSMWGYPADLIALPDGGVLSIYGYRRAPFGIRACLSEDGGETWLIEKELVIRDDLLSDRGAKLPYNLGYPTAVVLDDGSLFVVYWGEDGTGVTTIQGTHFSL